MNADNDRLEHATVVEVDHARKLVFATDIDRRTLEEIKTYLTAYANAQFDERTQDRLRRFWITYERVRNRVLR